MNQDQNQKGDFEDRLLAELRAIVADREPEREPEAVSSLAAWRRGPRLAVAGGAVTAVAAAVLIVGAGGRDTPAAYAVTPRDDGNLSVEIRSLGDPEGLAAALDAAGVPAAVEYVPTEAALPIAAACDVASADAVPGAEATVVEAVPAEPARLTVDPGDVGPGETLVLTAAPAGEGIAVETTVAETGAEMSEGGAEAVETEEACGAPVETVEAVPAVPAEGASEPGVPASR